MKARKDTWHELVYTEKKYLEILEFIVNDVVIPTKQQNLLTVP